MKEELRNPVSPKLPGFWVTELILTTSAQGSYNKFGAKADVMLCSITEIEIIEAIGYDSRST